MTTAPTPDQELTLQEAADELGVHYMTAYRYVRLGMLEASKRGRSWVVSREDLEAFRSAPASETASGVAWDERLLHRMLAPDDAGAWKVIEAALASGMEPRDVYLDVIAPALRAVGERRRGRRHRDHLTGSARGAHAHDHRAARGERCPDPRGRARHLPGGCTRTRGRRRRHDRPGGHRGDRARHPSRLDPVRVAAAPRSSAELPPITLTSSMVARTMS